MPRGWLCQCKLSLRHSQRLEGRAIDRHSYVKIVIALVIGWGRAGEWPEHTVYLAMIVAFLLQGGLHVRNHLISSKITIAVDRTVVGAIRLWSVAPGRIPPTRIPVIPTSGDEHNAVVATAPPNLIMPLRTITSKRCVALPPPLM